MERYFFCSVFKPWLHKWKPNICNTNFQLLHQCHRDLFSLSPQNCLRSRGLIQYSCKAQNTQKLWGKCSFSRMRTSLRHCACDQYCRVYVIHTDGMVKENSDQSRYWNKRKAYSVQVRYSCYLSTQQSKCLFIVTSFLELFVIDPEATSNFIAPVPSVLETDSYSCWGGKGPAVVSQSNPPAQSCHVQAGCPGPNRFWISPRMETPQPFCATCSCILPHGKEMLSCAQMEPPVFQFMPTASSLLPVQDSEEPEIFIYIDKITLIHFFSRLKSHSFLNISYERCSIPLISHVSLCWTCSSKFISLLYWGAHHWIQSITLGLSSPVLNRGERTPPLTIWWYFLRQPGIPFALFATRAPCWLMFTLVSTRTLRSFSAELLSICMDPSMYWCPELFLTGAGLCTSLFWNS